MRLQLEQLEQMLKLRIGNTYEEQDSLGQWSTSTCPEQTWIIVRVTGQFKSGVAHAVQFLLRPDTTAEQVIQLWARGSGHMVGFLQLFTRNGLVIPLTTVIHEWPHYSPKGVDVMVALVEGPMESTGPVAHCLAI